MNIYICEERNSITRTKVSVFIYHMSCVVLRRFLFGSKRDRRKILRYVPFRGVFINMRSM